MRTAATRILLLATLGVMPALLAAEDTGSPSFADVVSVVAKGAPGAVEFEVGVRSPDTGCARYADWWEVVDLDGGLIHRRILRHSHVDEQPFVRSGGPFVLDPDHTVWVRAHMHPDGYGGKAMRGSIRSGFVATELDPDFAAGLAEQPPLPDGCAF